MTRAEERALEAYPKSGNYTSSQRLIINDMRDGFIQGYEQAKKDMMEEAVEGEITKDNRGNNVVRSGVFNNGFEIGDKVRVIVCKKEDKKDM